MVVFGRGPWFLFLIGGEGFCVSLELGVEGLEVFLESLVIVC